MELLWAGIKPLPKAILTHQSQFRVALFKPLTTGIALIVGVGHVPLLIDVVTTAHRTLCICDISHFISPFSYVALIHKLYCEFLRTIWHLSF
jgi:hypothetical protein